MLRFCFFLTFLLLSSPEEIWIAESSASGLFLPLITAAGGSRDVAFSLLWGSINRRDGFQRAMALMFWFLVFGFFHPVSSFPKGREERGSGILARGEMFCSTFSLGGSTSATATTTTYRIDLYESILTSFEFGSVGVTVSSRILVKPPHPHRWPLLAFIQ
jgi:hypothetical protein